MLVETTMFGDAAGRREGPPGDGILAQLSGLIGPLTRFDRSSIMARQIGTESVEVAAGQRFDLQFLNLAESGRGQLPAGIEPVADNAALSSRTAEIARAARDALPARLQDWVARNSSRPDAT